MRHPFWNAGNRSVRLRNHKQINTAVGESPGNWHDLATTRMERICDPCLDRLLAGILSLFRATPESRGYRLHNDSTEATKINCPKDYPLGSSLGVYGEFTCTPGISGKMK